MHKRFAAEAVERLNREKQGDLHVIRVSGKTKTSTRNRSISPFAEEGLISVS